jgi:hypothetical protein
MSEPKDITATILREMRDEMRAGFARVESRIDALERRIEGVGSGLHGVQIILVKAVGTFDQRISAIEAKPR